MIWDIFNEFYPLSIYETRKMAEEVDFKEILEDLEKNGKERFVAKMLENLKISQDARAILDSYKNIIKITMPKRKELCKIDSYKKFHLEAWDIGFYQLKNGVMKEFFKKELKDFMSDFKQFGDRLRPMVYELGFLRK